LSASELQKILHPLSGGTSVIYYRRFDGLLDILALTESKEFVIGRRPSCGISLPQDRAVSRVHAILRQLGDEWVIEDDGLSRNGTYVNGARVTSARRLVDGDAILVGGTLLTHRTPHPTYDGRTEGGAAGPGQLGLTAGQRRVLEALCRPMGGFSPGPGPASNKEIAAELFLSVETVKSHMRALARLFSVTHLPQTQRRYAMAHSAFEWGLIRFTGSSASESGGTPVG
jgi:hypothetical protein